MSFRCQLSLEIHMPRLECQWLTGNALAVDTETTGIDAFSERIVQASCVEVGPSGVVDKTTWLVNPGIPIPPEATAVHHITDEMVQKDGIHPLTALTEMTDRIQRAQLSGLPIIIMNAPYDTTLIAAEAARVAIDGFSFGAVLDPLAIDRGLEPYRKGKRTLEVLAQIYGVTLTDAHSSEGDALCAARIVWVMARRHAKIAKLSLAAMQDWQARAHRDWATGFERFLRRNKPDAVVDASWPVRVAA